MQPQHLVRAALLLAALAACSQDNPASPGFTAPSADPGIPIPPPAPALERDRHERLAARMARAMQDPSFRADIYRELSTSAYPEKKVHLQSFLDREGGAERRRLASLTGESEENIAIDVDNGGSVELYFPVPEHREQWTGDTDLLVATAELDTDSPVAFNLQGRRVRLSADAPPDTPVLMVSRAETDFTRQPQTIECVVECGDAGSGGGGPAGSPSAGQGLFMTQTRFNGTFESWFKGSPEFEVHVLGQAPNDPTKMTTYQCAGEHAGGPYAFDQNGTTWSGNVMLLSQAQLDQYNQSHPGQNLRIFVVEDDDTACEIRIDANRVTNLLTGLKLVYGDLTGGNKLTTAAGVPAWKKVLMVLTQYKAISSFFMTNDDPVGNAVEDANAASFFFPGANWLVRGEHSTSNGAIKLEIR